MTESGLVAGGGQSHTECHHAPSPDSSCDYTVDTSFCVMESAYGGVAEAKGIVIGGKDSQHKLAGAMHYSPTSPAIPGGIAREARFDQN